MGPAVGGTLLDAALAPEFVRQTLLNAKLGRGQGGTGIPETLSAPPPETVMPENQSWSRWGKCHGPQFCPPVMIGSCQGPGTG